MTKKDSKYVTKQDIIDQLIKNNVELQKKSIEMMGSMHNLTKNINKLVEIFKKAAERIEKGEMREPLARKLSDLLEQNKRIANGLILLEKFVREKESYGLPKKEENVGNLF